MRNRPPDHHAFPVRYALDFQHVQLSEEDFDDVQMVWWLFRGYCPNMDIRPVGTRAELTCMLHLVAQRMRLVGEFAPRVQEDWPLYVRQGVRWASERMQRILNRDRAEFMTDGAPAFAEIDSLLFPFAPAPMPHVLILVYLRPLMTSISETARLINPSPPPPQAAVATSNNNNNKTGGKQTPPLQTHHHHHHHHHRSPSTSSASEPRILFAPCALCGLFRWLFMRPKKKIAPSASALPSSTYSSVAAAASTKRLSRIMQRSAISEMLELSNTLMQVVNNDERRSSSADSLPSPQPTAPQRISSSSSSHSKPVVIEDLDTGAKEKAS